MNGNILGWRNLRKTSFHASVTPNPYPLGAPSPFSTRTIYNSGGTIASIATANLTSIVNGTTLDCSNGSFIHNGTIIISYDLILKGKVMLMKNNCYCTV